MPDTVSINMLAAQVALLSVAKSGQHHYNCSLLTHYRNQTGSIPFSHRHKWKAAKQYAARTQPPCDCYVRLVVQVLQFEGIAIPPEVGSIDAGPDYRPLEDDE